MVELYTIEKHNFRNDIIIEYLFIRLYMHKYIQ